MQSDPLRDPVELREIVVVERYGHQIGERVVGCVDLILLGLARFIFDDFFNSAVRYRFRLIRRFLRKGGRWGRKEQGDGEPSVASRGRHSATLLHRYAFIGYGKREPALVSGSRAGGS